MMSQKYGDVARDQLKNKILNRYVEIKIKGKDKYGRAVAVIYLDGMDVNKWMLENGHAFLYEEYNDNEDYILACCCSLCTWT